MNEIWKAVHGYEGLYQVSNLGRVKSFKNGRERILKTALNKTGYLRVVLCRDGAHKNFSVHRLVALAFIPNPESKPQVNHKNGIKTDNRVENLEWCSASENAQHADKTNLRKQRGEDNWRAKITNKQAKEIRDNPDNLTGVELAEIYGVSENIISDIQLNKTYKTAGGKTRTPLRNAFRVPDEVREQIRREYVKSSREFGAPALAKKYKICKSTIRNIVKEKA